MRESPPPLLWAILAAFTLLGVVYSVGVPVFEASDEVWHYPMVEYLARTWQLPVQPLEPGASSGPWRQEASQPPLYYALGAALTAWIDTSDIDRVRHLNPHVAAGEVTPDGSNPNLVVHPPGRARFPWRGTVLAVHVVRLFSVALGAWAVYLTWALVQELYPPLALAAAALHAFTPMYLFVSASVNNDALIVPLCSLALLLMVRRVKAVGGGKSGKSANGQMGRSVLGAMAYLYLGSVIGLAILTKASGIGLLPLLGATVAWETWQQIRSPSNQHPPFTLLRFVAVRLLLALGPVLAISGWWFYRNVRLYGEWLGLNAFYAVLGTRDVPANLGQLWAERFAFAAGYWGNFGGLNVPMPTWIYTLLNATAVAAAAGLTVGFLRWLLSRPVAAPLRLQRKLWPFAWPPRTAARALAWAWPAAVFVSWTRWATVTWSSQGRLIFSAIPMWSLALALGLQVWADVLFSRRPTTPSPSSVNAPSPSSVNAPSPSSGDAQIFGFAAMTPLNALLPAALLLLCVVALPAWIAPAYRPPPTTDAAPPIEHSAVLGDVLRLRGYRLETDTAQPGEPVALTLYWEAIAPTATDHSLFIHVLGQGDRIVAQRDTFPGRGLVSTTWLTPGRRWTERYAIEVPPVAYAPDTLTFALGMYETATGVRLPVHRPEGDVGETTRLGRVALAPNPGAVPNPVYVRFGPGMALVGYDVSDVVAARGERVTVTLHWACEAPIDADYTVSVQLIDAQWRKAAQSDAWPQDGAAPTSTWQVGQTLQESRVLTLAPQAEPGAYDLRVVVYRVDEDGDLIHLPVSWSPAQMPAKAVVLTRIRVR
jgi:hypothetical protein